MTYLRWVIMKIGSSCLRNTSWSRCDVSLWELSDPRVLN